ncbi:SufD family Fe-S cluster assembly protein [bacterium]|jgi:Fe-S cluster assembly scaffold protein SufB|nr:SufD family Fe-S cluster assembly protein [bacterium]MBT6294033.1 SufD family Fe-S cluster assembly protein [bacterium]
MNNLQNLALEKLKNFDKKSLLKNGLNLDYEVNNPICNLSILEDYIDDYPEFFEDPFVLDLISKNASVFKYKISNNCCLEITESEIYNSIVIIEAEDNATASCMLEGFTSFPNYCVLIVCKENSNFELVTPYKTAGQVCCYQYLKENANARTIVLNSCSQYNSYFNYKSFLIGKGSSHNFFVYAKFASAKHFLYVTNHFKVADCKGEIWIDGILDDAAYAKIIGSINIDLQGANTDSYMKKDIIMLDDKSKLDCVPALEIKTNDVKAGHGVSVSKFDKEKKFYLQSRGLNDVRLINLVCDGLLFKNIDKINSDHYRKAMIDFHSRDL